MKTYEQLWKWQSTKEKALYECNDKEYDELSEKIFEEIMESWENGIITQAQFNKLAEKMD